MKHTQTAYLILGVLSFHPHQTGYHIRKTVEGGIRYFWGESYGQLYPTLKRLAAEGLIEPSGVEGPKRAQAYSITDAGRACLQEWLAVPFREDPPRDEFLLKLFFGVNAGPEIAIGQLNDFQQRARKLLATLQEMNKLAAKQNKQHPGFPYWMLTLEYGLAQVNAALDWSDRAAAELRRLSRQNRKQENSHG
jgi:DNA-binding PadR family transcriptional regulator